MSPIRASRSDKSGKPLALNGRIVGDLSERRLMAFSRQIPFNQRLFRNSRDFPRLWPTGELAPNFKTIAVFRNYDGKATVAVALGEPLGALLAVAPVIT
jgi:hypothetical protein